MCGIIGLIGNTKDSFQMLQKNETRGGHAWGIAYNSPFEVFKMPGTVPKEQPSWWPTDTNIIIGHTRFATHGKPEINENNHPHFSKNYAIIHNGVLGGMHPKQRTECDSEIILKMIIERAPKTKEETVKAIKKIVKKLNGSWRIALLNNHTPNTVYVFNDTDPVYWGVGHDCMVFASEEKDLPKNLVRFQAVNNGLYVVEAKDGRIQYEFCKLHVQERIQYYQTYQSEYRKKNNNVFDWEAYKKTTPKMDWLKPGDQCWACSHVIKDNGSCITCDCDHDCPKCQYDCTHCNKYKMEMSHERKHDLG